MSATEQFESRTGSAGANNWNRLRKYRVSVDSGVSVDGQDPLADPDLPLRGTSYGGFPGVVVTHYTLSERMSLREWMVDVIYGVPAALTPSFGGLWEVSVSSSFETEQRVLTTMGVDGIIDEKRRRRRGGVSSAELIIVGPWLYVKKEENESVPPDRVFKTTVRTVDKVTGLVKDVSTELKRLDLRKSEPMTVTVPVATLTLKRRFDRMANYGPALAKTQLVNSDAFYGAGVGQLKFLAIHMIPILVEASVNPVGVGSEVLLNFQWRREGHQHSVVHMYEDADGIKSPVLSLEGDEEVVVETFTRYAEISFTDLIARL